MKRFYTVVGIVLAVMTILSMFVALIQGTTVRSVEIERNSQRIVMLEQESKINQEKDHAQSLKVAAIQQDIEWIKAEVASINKGTQDIIKILKR